MKRNKPGAMPAITRDIYKGVKKFDRQQFEGFCKDLYTFGFEDGRDSVPAVSLDTVCDVISRTRGIGPKKLEEIRANLEGLFAASQKEAGRS